MKSEYSGATKPEIKLYTSRIRLFYQTTGFSVSAAYSLACLFAFLSLRHIKKCTLFSRKLLSHTHTHTQTDSLTEERHTKRHIVFHLEWKKRKKRDLHGCRLQIVEITATHYSTRSHKAIMFIQCCFFSFFFFLLLLFSAFAGWQRREEKRRFIFKQETSIMRRITTAIAIFVFQSNTIIFDERKLLFSFLFLCLWI